MTLQSLSVTWYQDNSPCPAVQATLTLRFAPPVMRSRISLSFRQANLVCEVGATVFRSTNEGERALANQLYGRLDSADNDFLITQSLRTCEAAVGGLHHFSIKEPS